MNFEERLQADVLLANRILEAFLPEEHEEDFTGRLAEAMRYSLLAGGKRVRPVLLLESCRMFGGSDADAAPFMAAIEMIHTHSLVHDDLPAIDNDALRRGKPTTHTVYGEAMGVLAGDALLNYAYETVLNAFDPQKSALRRMSAEGRALLPDPEEMSASSAGVLEALRVLAAKTGISGMLGGQSVDVENEKNGTLQIDARMLQFIYQNKTSALIEAPLMIGAVLGGADREDIDDMKIIGSRIGLAFQIRDDILDISGNAETLGKPLHSDEANEKTTWASLYGEAESEKKVRELTAEALGILRGMDGDSSFLEWYLNSLAYRDR